MALIVEELGDGSAAAWDAFVADCPDATFFHRAGWRRVIAGSLGRPAHFLLARRGGEIAGVLPLVHMNSRLFGNRLVSTAFTTGGGVAAVDDEARAALDAAAIRLMNRVGAAYVEYRQPPRPHAEGEGWSRRDGLHATFERPIGATDEAELKLYTGNKRRELKKALEGGLVDEADPHAGRFYPVFAETMRDLGTPVWGRRFFDALTTEFKGDCDCTVIGKDGRLVAAGLCFYFRDRMILHFLGNLPAARELGATNVLLWRLARRAAARGISVFDYGRSKVDSGNFAFKKNCGFTPRPIANEFFLPEGARPPELNPTNPRYGRFIEAWKRLPLAVANLVGPQLMRHIG